MLNYRRSWIGSEMCMVSVYSVDGRVPGWRNGGAGIGKHRFSVSWEVRVLWADVSHSRMAL